MSVKIAAERIAKTMQQSPEGFTIFADSDIPFRPPFQAFLIGGSVPSLKVETGSNTTVEQIEEWYSHALDNHHSSIVGPIIGGWLNDGIYHLDSVTVIFSEAKALELGRLRGELAIGVMDTAGVFRELVLS